MIFLWFATLGMNFSGIKDFQGYFFCREGGMFAQLLPPLLFLFICKKVKMLLFMSLRAKIQGNCMVYIHGKCIYYLAKRLEEMCVSYRKQVREWTMSDSTLHNCCKQVWFLNDSFQTDQFCLCIWKECVGDCERTCVSGLPKSDFSRVKVKRNDS